MSSNDVKIVLDVIQKGYNDATQTILDLRVAENILDALRQAGWIDLDTVAALIASAGGSIFLKDKYLVNPPNGIWIEERVHLDGRKVSVDCE